MLFLLLNEFAALGRLEAIERAMGLMAGYGRQLLRVQGNPTALARKLRYYADPEFKGLFQPEPH